MGEKGLKRSFFWCPISFKITLAKENRKGEEGPKKAMVTLHGRGSNLFKNPAKYIKILFTLMKVNPLFKPGLILEVRVFSSWK